MATPTTVAGLMDLPLSLSSARISFPAGSIYRIPPVLRSTISVSLPVAITMLSPFSPSLKGNAGKASATTNDLTGATVSFNIVNTLTNRYEVMGYAAQSYTTALGATPNVENLTKSLNLISLWPSPDPLGNEYASHFYHSAQFRGDAVWEWNYWNSLLFSSQAGFNISNP